MSAAPKSAEPISVVEMFERELEMLRAKEKDMKIDRRKFYRPILDRVKLNIDVLRGLLEEHSILRAKLSQLVQEKRMKGAEPDPASAQHRLSHEVNLLKKQLDLFKSGRTEAVQRRDELAPILENYQRAAVPQFVEEQRMKVLRNKLDKSNIKNNETKHLMKLYAAIIDHFDPQQIVWNLVVQGGQREIERKRRNIFELTLIARDSKHSKLRARTKYAQTQKQCAENQRKREQVITTRKRQLIDIDHSLSPDTDWIRNARSIDSRPSQYRQRMNRQIRERQEERYRQMLVQAERIREEFGTNDPKEIETVFVERRQTTATLH
jgi:hypothetical protein